MQNIFAKFCNRVLFFPLCVCVYVSKATLIIIVIITISLAKRRKLPTNTTADTENSRGKKHTNELKLHSPTISSERRGRERAQSEMERESGEKCTNKIKDHHLMGIIRAETIKFILKR